MFCILMFISSPESLSLYFSKYGEITNCVIMHDKITGRPRGFGFVTFADSGVAEKVLEENHVIDGRSVRIIFYNSAQSIEFSFVTSFCFRWIRISLRTVTCTLDVR